MQRIDVGNQSGTTPGDEVQRARAEALWEGDTSTITTIKWCDEWWSEAYPSAEEYFEAFKDSSASDVSVKKTKNIRAAESLKERVKVMIYMNTYAHPNDFKNLRVYIVFGSLSFRT